jgi:hypothetical protein
VLFPYYGGLIRHTQDGSLPAARIVQYWNGGPGLVFDHLSLVGPSSNAGIIAALAALYTLATLMLCLLAALDFRLAWAATKLLRNQTETARPPSGIPRR